MFFTHLSSSYRTKTDQKTNANKLANKLVKKKDIQNASIKLSQRKQVSLKSTRLNSEQRLNFIRMKQYRADYCDIG